MLSSAHALASPGQDLAARTGTVAGTGTDTRPGQDLPSPAGAIARAGTDAGPGPNLSGRTRGLTQRAPRATFLRCRLRPRVRAVARTAAHHFAALHPPPSEAGSTACRLDEPRFAFSLAEGRRATPIAILRYRFESACEHYRNCKNPERTRVPRKRLPRNYHGTTPPRSLRSAPLAQSALQVMSLALLLGHPGSVGSAVFRRQARPEACPADYLPAWPVRSAPSPEPLKPPLP